LFPAAAGLAWAGFSDDVRVCQNEVLPGLPHKGTVYSAKTAGDQYCLAIAYWIGPLGRNNYDESAKWLRKAADQNHPAAQATLGHFYKTGHGVKQDFGDAARWWKKAADNGNTDAMVGLATLYESGQGVKQDQREAVAWYRKAAERGDANAQNSLQRLENPSAPAHAQPGQDLFEEGKKLYLAKDYKAAFAKFQKAADKGNALGQLQIGYQYENGEGVQENAAQAVKWYAKAASQGQPIAQKNLGQMYENGEGVAENWVEAAKWYRKSAEQNYSQGQAALGRAYQFGIGVPQNRSEAIAWYKRAAALGDSKSEYFANQLRSPSNFIGFRNDEEHNLVIGGKLRFALAFQEPVGRLFRNSSERQAYITNVRKDVDQSEAETFWNILNSEYQTCRRSGGSNCHPPGPRPR
jgi:TPR repeat protein